MSSQNPIFDPVDAQMRDMGKIGKDEITIDDLTNPVVIRLIMQQNEYNLIALKASTRELAELRDKYDGLRDELEKQRISNAKSNEQDLVSWAEIPVGFLGGIAITRLSTGLADVGGWILLFVSLVILLFFRIPRLPALIRKVKGNGKN